MFRNFIFIQSFFTVALKYECRNDNNIIIKLRAIFLILFKNLNNRSRLFQWHSINAAKRTARSSFLTWNKETSKFIKRSRGRRFVWFTRFNVPVILKNLSVTNDAFPQSRNFQKLSSRIQEFFIPFKKQVVNYFTLKKKNTGYRTFIKSHYVVKVQQKHSKVVLSVPA